MDEIYKTLKEKKIPHIHPDNLHLYQDSNALTDEIHKLSLEELIHQVNNPVSVSRVGLNMTNYNVVHTDYNRTQVQAGLDEVHDIAFVIVDCFYFEIINDTVYYHAIHDNKTYPVDSSTLTLVKLLDKEVPPAYFFSDEAKCLMVELAKSLFDLRVKHETLVSSI